VNMALDLALKMLPPSGSAKTEIRWRWDADTKQLNLQLLTADGKQVAAVALKINPEALGL